jgi:hypothetical protein
LASQQSRSMTIWVISAKKCLPDDAWINIGGEQKDTTEQDRVAQIEADRFIHPECDMRLTARGRIWDLDSHSVAHNSDIHRAIGALQSTARSDTAGQNRTIKMDILPKHDLVTPCSRGSR